MGLECCGDWMIFKDVLVFGGRRGGGLIWGCVKRCLGWNE